MGGGGCCCCIQNDLLSLNNSNEILPFLRLFGGISYTAHGA